jgi:hypothetical protein
VKTVSLASGRVTNSDDLIIQEIQPDTHPPKIVIRWPAAPSIVEPRDFQKCVAKIMKILSDAVIELAARRRASRHQVD